MVYIVYYLIFMVAQTRKSIENKTYLIIRAIGQWFILVDFEVVPITAFEQQFFSWHQNDAEQNGEGQAGLTEHGSNEIYREQMGA